VTDREFKESLIRDQEERRRQTERWLKQFTDRERKTDRWLTFAVCLLILFGLVVGLVQCCRPH
jgi:hypothetical protein